MCALTDLVKSNRASGMFTVVVSLDISGAFDSANWSKLVDALEKREAPRYLINMIRSYLNDRFVETSNPETGRRRLTQGVPQGSCLGPTLFCVLMDELLCAESLEGEWLQAYADDTLLSFTVPDLNPETLSECERTVAKIFEVGELLSLKFNAAKTQLTVFNRKKKSAPPQIAIRIGDTEVRSSSQFTYLGVLFDDRLFFNEHLKRKIAKANMTLSCLRRAAAGGWGLSAER